ncbi:MAG: DJ-1/PfpI family protein [Clostridia bacterium]|nr:DJ-1/PfpI family protein [Clostridia bacterium]
MIYLFLADGFETVEALCPLDILRRAGMDVKTVGVTGESVKSRQNVTVLADMRLDEIPDELPEMIILPGGIPGADNLAASEKLMTLIPEWAERGSYVTAICAAPYILGELGLLRGKRATCYPDQRYIDKLQGAQYISESVVRDGKIITGKAMGAALDFALELASALCGREKAESISRSVCHDS